MQIGGSASQRMKQLELLSDACHTRGTARVVELHTPRPRTVISHFLALRADALLMDWPNGQAPRELLVNADVDIYFEHNGQRFACETCTRGQVLIGARRAGIQPAWRLALPRCVELREQRGSQRLDLRARGTISATLIDMDEPERPLAAELVSVSAGGLRALVPADCAERLPVGRGVRIDFALPGMPDRFRVIARVVHAALEPHGGGLALGCRFLPGEQPTTHAAQSQALDRFVRAGAELDSRRAANARPEDRDA